ncbi:MAG: GrpB family protein [Actinomycetota bacterium]
MVQARIEIVGYSPSWADEFARESSQIAEVLCGVLIAVHHIGSTAIPGCDAKSIIDMLAVVTNLDDLDARTAALEGLGYEALGEFGIPGRRYFRKGSAFEDRTHQIHAFADGSTEIARHLAFRDHLRGNPEAVKEYVALKRRLAAEHPTDVEAYTDGKTAFIKAIEEAASI